jgi:integrase
LAEIDRGWAVEPMKATLGEFLENWHAARKPMLSAYTYRRYSAILKGQIQPRLGGLVLGKLSRGQVVTVFKAFFAEIADRGGARSDADPENGDAQVGRSLSSTTCRQVYNFMHAAFEQAIREGALSENPLNGVEPPKVRKVESPVLEHSDLERLIEALRGTRFFIPTLLGGLCGLRRSEVLALRYSDIRFDDRSVTVRRALQQAGNVVDFKTTKSGKDRTIPMPKIVANALLLEQKKVRLRRGEAYSDDDLVVCYGDGNVWPPESFTPRFIKAASKAGFPSLYYHTLRHTAITLWLRAGVPVKVVQEWAGHHSAAFTLDRYGHVTPTAGREAVERIDASFPGWRVRGEGPPIYRLRGHFVGISAAEFA